MKLVFATPPQSVVVNSCSNPLVIESRDALDQLSAVTTDTVIIMSSAPLGISFFSDSMCNSTANPRLTAGSSRLTLYFRASNVPPGGGSTITASSTLSPATQLETILPAPDGLTLTSNGNTVPAGSCVAATVTATAAGAPIALSSDTGVGVAANPIGAAKFFTDPACATTAVSSVTISRGTSSRDFFIRPISGGVTTITATAPFGSDSITLRANPAVRRGTCNMGSVSTSVNCTVSPAQADLTHTLLVFQAIVPNTNEPNAAEVRCRLSATDTINCIRQTTGPGGIGGVTIAWQTLELPTNLAVQRQTSVTCPLGVLALAPSVDLTRAFALSTVWGIGTNYDGDDMAVARLTDGGVVFDAMGQSCNGFELQVAEWGSGVSVLRGSQPGFGTNSRVASAVGLSAASANAVVLGQSNMVGGSVPNSASMCHFFTRADIDTSTSLKFTRGSTSPNGCDNYNVGQIVWQRIDFGSRARVLSQVVSLSQNSGSTTATLNSAVDMSRTLVFSSGGMASGQGTGETAWDNGGNDEITDVVATFELINATQVRVTRAEFFTTALFTMYAVEFDP